MTVITRTSAKSYFVTAAKPSQSQFADTLDSVLFQSGASAQAIQSNVSAAGVWDFKSDVNVSGALTIGTLSATILSTTNLSVSNVVSAAGVYINGDLSMPTGRVIASAGQFTEGVIAGGTVNASAGYVGNQTGVNPPANQIGYTVQAIAGSLSINFSTGTSKTIATLPLPVGLFSVNAAASFVPSGAMTIINAGISTATNTLPSDPSFTKIAATFSGSQVIPTPHMVVNVTTSTNYFLVGNSTFAAACSGGGMISATRIG